MADTAIITETPVGGFLDLQAQEEIIKLARERAGLEDGVAKDAIRCETREGKTILITDGLDVAPEAQAIYAMQEVVSTKLQETEGRARKTQPLPEAAHDESVVEKKEGQQPTLAELAQRTAAAQELVSQALNNTAMSPEEVAALVGDLRRAQAASQAAVEEQRERQAKAELEAGYITQSGNPGNRDTERHTVTAEMGAQLHKKIPAHLDGADLAIFTPKTVNGAGVTPEYMEEQKQIMMIALNKKANEIEVISIKGPPEVFALAGVSAAEANRVSTEHKAQIARERAAPEIPVGAGKTQTQTQPVAKVKFADEPGEVKNLVAAAVMARDAIREKAEHHPIHARHLREAALRAAGLDLEAMANAINEGKTEVPDAKTLKAASCHLKPDERDALNALLKQHMKEHAAMATVLTVGEMQKPEPGTASDFPTDRFKQSVCRQNVGHMGRLAEKAGNLVHGIVGVGKEVGHTFTDDLVKSIGAEIKDGANVRKAQHHSDAIEKAISGKADVSEALQQVAAKYKEAVRDAKVSHENVAAVGAHINARATKNVHRGNDGASRF